MRTLYLSRERILARQLRETEVHFYGACKRCKKQRARIQYLKCRVRCVACKAYC